MKDAIKKAIEGGWVPRQHAQLFHPSFEVNTPVLTVQVGDHYTLDPLFWQALGKQQGWKDGDVELPLHSHLEWSRQWHRFIDHLAEGKDADSFFNNLLK